MTAEFHNGPTTGREIASMNHTSPSYGLWHKKSNWYPSKVDEPLQILHVQRVQPSKNDMYICYIAILQDFDDFDRTLIINPS